MVQPIKPSEASQEKINNLPEGVIQAFNELIVENLSNGSATIMQGVAVDRICQKMQCSKQEVFAKHWLDVEESYRQAGWSVQYDKPGYCETYEASFVFSHK